jgi:hypothetical protein
MSLTDATSSNVEVKDSTFYSVYDDLRDDYDAIEKEIEDIANAIKKIHG